MAAARRAGRRADEAEIRALAVAPGTQQGGVGTRLLVTALNWAELAGARRVVLSTLPQMRAAHRLYERTGFRRAARPAGTGRPGPVSGSWPTAWTWAAWRTAGTEPGGGTSAPP